MKIKINKCTNPRAWYLQAVGKEMEIITFTEDGEALISPEVVKSIDGEDDVRSGLIEFGDFTIVQEDNRTITT
ncbi:hypothetical protein [Pedobacter sp. NJ-S-72]